MKIIPNHKKKNKDSFFLLIGKFTSRKNLNKTDKYLFFCLFFVIVFLSDFCNLKQTSFIKNYISGFIIPLKCTANNIVEIPKLISEYMDIKRENKRLHMELDDFKIKIITAKETESELTELKKSINMKYSISNFGSVEKVLGFDKGIYESYLIISATQKETKPGGIVISSDGLIGTILEIIDKTAIVMTISDEKMYIPVKSNSGEHLILSGFGANLLISKEIKESHSEAKINLQKEDMLYASGEGGIFHSNIPVAKVKTVDYNKNEITATPVANLKNISFVWVLDPILKNRHVAKNSN